MNRRGMVSCAAGLLACLAFASVYAAEATPAASAGSAKSVAASRERYNQIIANLDAGGDLLVVANLEGFVQEMVDNVSQLVRLAPESSENGSAVTNVLGKLPGFLRRNGFYGMQGFGMSVAPRADGLNTIKGFVARDPASLDTPLWRGLVGSAPKKLSCLSLLPADTVFVRAGTGELNAMWKMIKSGVTEFASPAAAAELNRWITGSATNIGVNMDTLFDSFSGEGFFSIQLSETATVSIPAKDPDQPPMKIPQPSMLVAAAVTDNAMMKLMDTLCARQKVPVTQVQSESVTIHIINLPLPTPFPLQLSYAMHGKYFLLGSTPQAISAAVKAAGGNNGLTASAHYRKLFQGQAEVNNGIQYVSPRLIKAILDAQMAGQAHAAKSDAQASEALRNWLANQSRMESGFTILNGKTGVLVSGTSSAGGRELVGSVMIAPVGLLAAIAVPSFVKARSTAQMNACINNLRMLDAAKEMWALESKAAEGAEVDVSAMLQYLRGGKMPVCPQGGIYQVNVIGQNPECSIPKHRLPGGP